jgi:hypothetical protein
LGEEKGRRDLNEGCSRKIHQATVTTLMRKAAESNERLGRVGRRPSDDLVQSRAKRIWGHGGEQSRVALDLR